MKNYVIWMISFAVTNIGSLVFIYDGRADLAIYSLLSFVCIMLIMCACYLSEAVHVMRKAFSEIKFHLDSILDKMPEEYDENVKTELVDPFERGANFLKKSV